jgi:hypothetical protein
VNNRDPMLVDIYDTIKRIKKDMQAIKTRVDSMR